MVPDITVIIPVRNGSQTLSLCLDSVFRSEGIRRGPEVIVVDDASEDDSAEVAAQFPVQLIRLNRSLGGGLTRNPGVERAHAGILLFTDADVELEPQTLRLVMESFRARPGLHALFGAYSKDCPRPDFLSQYKNLHHHFIHWTAAGRATTFWTGCGAVRREVFLQVGGFRSVPYIYDVDLGYRLSAAGYRVEVLPHIQVRHHKQYTPWTLLRSEVLERAVPWTELLWEHRRLLGGLNTRPSHVFSVAAVYLGLLSALLPWSAGGKAVGPLIALLGVCLLNWRWAAFCVEERGVGFALRALVMELFYFFYSGFGLVLGTVLWGARTAFGRLSRAFGPGLRNRP
ncbi:MAG: glycosyltransferase [Deltaproteobacteria bacterium]|nr:glycosyltransferase [Deltaproteobacteria bacterium]